MKIACKNIVIRLDKKTIFNDISFDIENESITAILGMNGSGKTTILRSLVGLQTIDQGSIIIDGKCSLQSMNNKQRAKTIGWLPQLTEIPFNFTALDLVVLGRYAWHNGYPTDHDRQIAISSLEMVDAGSLTDRYTHTLSRGELQKVFIARLLAGDSKILCMDEPFASLDIHASLKLVDILKKEIKSKKQTLCISFHDLTLAKRLATHFLAILPNGLIKNGSMDEDLNVDLIEAIYDVQAKEVKSSDGESLYYFK